MQNWRCSLASFSGDQQFNFLSNQSVLYHVSYMTVIKTPNIISSHRIKQERQCMCNVTLWHWCYGNTKTLYVMFPLYCCWPTGSCQRNKTNELCYGNARWVRLPPPLSNKICCTAFNHTNVPWYLCKVPSIAVQFHPNLESQKIFIKVPKIQFQWKSIQWEP